MSLVIQNRARPHVTDEVQYIRPLMQYGIIGTKLSLDFHLYWFDNDSIMVSHCWLKRSLYQD